MVYLSVIFFRFNFMNSYELKNSEVYQASRVDARTGLVVAVGATLVGINSDPVAKTGALLTTLTLAVSSIVDTLTPVDLAPYALEKGGNPDISDIDMTHYEKILKNLA
jgi:hypothetical protein